MRSTQPEKKPITQAAPVLNAQLLTTALVTPQLPIDERKGPGPLPTSQMEKEQDNAFWKDMAKIGIAKGTGRLGEFGFFDGVVHRDPRVVELTKHVVADMHKLLDLPEGALAALQDAGGNGAGYNAWVNLLSRNPNVPLVILNYGAFGQMWAKDLKEQFADKGFIHSVIEVKVPEGTVPTQKDITKALREAGIGAGEHFNLLATSHETGTGAALSQETMQWIADNKNIDIALLDVTSGLLTQKIPGLGSTVSAFGALQKGLRAPTSIGLAVVAKEHTHYLKEKDSKLPLPSFISWSFKDNAGKLQIRSGIFDGTGVARSMAATDTLRLYYCLRHALSKGTKNKSAQAACVEDAKQSSRFCQEVIEEHIAQRKSEGKAPILKFLVADKNDRGAFNIVLTTGIDIGRADLQKVKARTIEILTREGRLINVPPFPYGETAETNIFRFTTLGINSKAEAQVVFDNLLYGFERARAEITGKSDIMYVSPAANSSDKPLKGDKPARNPKSEVIKGLIVDPVGLIKGADGKPDISAAKAHAEAKGWIWHDGAIAADAVLSTGVHVSYQPNISPDEIKKQSANGQYDFCIAAAKLVPVDTKFAEGAVRMGSGVNNMQSRSFNDGAPLMNTPGQNARTTAQFCIQTMLESCMNIGEISKKVAEGQILTPDILQYANRGLIGRKIAIIGITGDIGQEVTKLAKVFGMEVVGWSPSFTQEMAASAGIKYAATPADAVREADFVSLHIPLNDKTKGFVGVEIFKAMKPNATLVNAARAEIVDEKAAEQFLSRNNASKIITDADIFDSEKGPLAPFIALGHKFPKQVTNYPHIGADCNHGTRVEAFCQAVNQIVIALLQRVVVNNAGKLPEGYTDGSKQKPDGIGTLFSNASVESTIVRSRL